MSLKRIASKILSRRKARIVVVELRVDSKAIAAAIEPQIVSAVLVARKASKP